MKKLIFILLLLPIFSIGQGRFGKEFTEADKAFKKQAELASKKSAKETDSILILQLQLLKVENSSFLLDQWGLYLKNCKKPYYKDTIIRCYNNGYFLVPQVFYIKKWHDPNWTDFWDRYLKENKIIKFE